MFARNVKKNLNKNSKGSKAGSKHLSDLRFAHDVVLLAKTSEELNMQHMMEKLNRESLQAGLQMIAKKSCSTNMLKIIQVMVIQGEWLERVNGYVLPGPAATDNSLTQAGNEKTHTTRMEYFWKAN